MKTIIVATDYSAAATTALEYAAALARQSGARLAIINSYTLAVPKAVRPNSLHDVKKCIAEKQERVERLAKEISLAYGIKAEGIANSRYLVEELDRRVKQLQADLVVMGMKGASLSSKIIGSYTSHVMRHAWYPVMVIPAEAKFNGLHNILFAFDYKSIGSNHSLSFLKALALDFNASVQVLHVEKDLKKVRTAAKDPELKNGIDLEMLLEGVPHSYRLLEAGTVITGLQRGILGIMADLVAMVPHKRGTWESVINPSQTERMALATHVPLLILPNLKSPAAEPLSRPDRETAAQAGI